MATPAAGVANFLLNKWPSDAAAPLDLAAVAAGQRRRREYDRGWAVEVAICRPWRRAAVLAEGGGGDRGGHIFSGTMATCCCCTAVAVIGEDVESSATAVAAVVVEAVAVNDSLSHPFSPVPRSRRIPGRAPILCGWLSRERSRFGLHRTP